MSDACVVKAFKHLSSETRRGYLSDLKQFLDWLWGRTEWADKMPSQLLAFQDDAKGRARFILPDLMSEFIQAKGGTYSSMITQLSHLRTFFIANRVELPGVGKWRPTPTREPAKSDLTFDQVREIILHADLRDRAIYLTLLQGMMDLERFTRFNRKYAAALVKHIRDGRLDEPFRVDFLSGRKKNRRAYYTFLYRDALEAWRQYFEKERGWPGEDDVIAITAAGRSPTKKTIRDNFIRSALRLRIRKPQKTKWAWSGVAPHEAFRDVVRSRLQTARKKGYDTLCSEFWMGHTVDPFNYNKFTEKEVDYVLENARIASEYLNITSMTGADQESAQEVKSLREEVRQLRGQFETILKIPKIGQP
ncbi:MAG TPA: hypothetical protein VED24_04060 [Candidatus Acidoferrum sp.]|nr:hypothetical protein [Candidatus Acidoferrum sp.]